MGNNNLPPLTFKFDYTTCRDEQISFLFGDLKGKTFFP